MSKIACDLDGVVFKFTEKFIEFYNARFGLNDKSEDVTNWHWWKCDNISITQEQFTQALIEFTKLRVWQSIPIFEDVYANLCALSLAGHEIIYITDRTSEARRATAKSIIKNGLPFDGLIFSKGNNKQEIAKVIGCEYAIDDKLSTVYDYANSDIITYLKLMNHNRDDFYEMINKQPNNIKISNIRPVENFYEFSRNILMKNNK